MRIIQNITDEEKKSILEDLYKSFETGFDFEVFLKPFLEVLGLKEVAVTKKTGDGGIDLLGVMPGLSELNGADQVEYKIQAKRYKPSTTISPEKIDALRGNLGFNQKGLFITTAKLTDKAKEEAQTKDPSKPVIVIDGTMLVDICIQKQIGCAYKPIFSSDALSDFLNSGKKEEAPSPASATKDSELAIQGVSKLITDNDIRASIISVPSSIANLIANNSEKHTVKIRVNGEEKYRKATFVPGRKYLASVTDILKEFKLKGDDGSYNSKTGVWAISTDGEHIELTIKE